eukprot:scaffold19865_cov120-Isochrysis_galbana.AAC.4
MGRDAGNTDHIHSNRCPTCQRGTPARSLLQLWWRAERCTSGGRVRVASRATLLCLVTMYCDASVFCMSRICLF